MTHIFITLPILKALIYMEMNASDRITYLIENWMPENTFAKASYDWHLFIMVYEYHERIISTSIAT